MHTSDKSLCKKTIIHQVTTMLAACKNDLFPGHNHLLTTSADDFTSLAGTRAIITMLGHLYQWLAGGYDLEIEVANMVVTWWIVFFCAVNIPGQSNKGQDFHVISSTHRQHGKVG